MGEERKLTEEAREALLGATLTEYDKDTKTWGKATLAIDEFEKIQRAVVALEAALAQNETLRDLLLVAQRDAADTGERKTIEEIAEELGIDLEALAAVPVETQEEKDVTEKEDARHAEVIADYVAQLEELDAERYAAQLQVHGLEELQKAAEELQPHIPWLRSQNVSPPMQTALDHLAQALAAVETQEAAEQTEATNG